MAGPVMLIHGLWFHGIVMWPLQRRLEQRGYDVRTYSYPSVRLDLDENTERLRAFCERHSGVKLDFVGHSLGGIVALEAAERLPPACRGRVVLLGSPVAGSESAQRLQQWRAGRALLGRCVPQWLSRARDRTFSACEVGIIAGDGGVGLGRLIAPGLPEPNDGVVTVEETRLPGMTDHIELPVSHSEMLVSRAVVEQICAFLQHGRFHRA